ncbi:MAG: GrpB family protein [Candidatus Marinimicrobia bacterium]|nr:GrpB family protein [Candidatus Neomarinimicrobiota bacterium]
MRIQVVAYERTTRAWRHDFEAEAKRIARALGNFVVYLHHIGSTATPGIFAKPIINILLEVDEIFKLDHRSATMENLAYKPMGEYGIPGRRYFHKENASGIRTHQVHAFNAKSDNIERHLAFRHYMIAHPAEAQTYRTKAKARELPNDIKAYMDGKDPYIKEYEDKANAWRLSHTAK